MWSKLNICGTLFLWLSPTCQEFFLVKRSFGKICNFGQQIFDLVCPARLFQWVLCFTKFFTALLTKFASKNVDFQALLLSAWFKKQYWSDVSFSTLHIQKLPILAHYTNKSNLKQNFLPHFHPEDTISIFVFGQIVLQKKCCFIQKWYFYKTPFSLNFVWLEQNFVAYLATGQTVYEFLFVLPTAKHLANSQFLFAFHFTIFFCLLNFD